MNSAVLSRSSAFSGSRSVVCRRSSLPTQFRTGASVELKRSHAVLVRSRSCSVKTCAAYWPAGPGFWETRDRGADVVENFGQQRWRVHEETGRYWRHTLLLFRSRVLTQLKYPLMLIGLISAAVCQTYSHYSSLGVALGQAPLVPFTLTSTVIGLLLVFRTNASYARFWEARSLWGLIVNRTRDLNRQTATWFSKSAPAKHHSMRACFQRWTAAFVYSLKCHLREKGDLAADLKDILPPRELEALLAAKHRPLYALQVLSELVAASDASVFLKGQMDENLTQLEDALGACEKILRTPIPASYTRQTSRFLVLWLTCLPLALWGPCGWATIPIAVLIAFCMLGIEEIGVSIEEPFTHLSLDAICGTITANTRELVETHGPRPGDANGAAPSGSVSQAVSAN